MIPSPYKTISYNCEHIGSRVTLANTVLTKEDQLKREIDKINREINGIKEPAFTEITFSDKNGSTSSGIIDYRIETDRATSYSQTNCQITVPYRRELATYFEALFNLKRGASINEVKIKEYHPSSGRQITNITLHQAAFIEYQITGAEINLQFIPNYVSYDIC